MNLYQPINNLDSSMAFGAVVLMPVNGDLIVDDEIPGGYVGTTASCPTVLLLERSTFSMSLSSTPEIILKLS